MDFWKWFRGCLKRFVIFAAFVAGFTRTMSWFLATDDAVQKWLTTNRPLTIVLIFLSFIMFAMYDFLQEPNR